MLDSDPDLDVFLTENFGENEHFAAALGSGSGLSDWQAGHDSTSG